ncbi:helix-turn-helix domain-containing protein [Sphingopyxis sp. H050]
MLGIGKSTLYEMIAAGEIETIKIGRSTLVPTDSLRAFLARRRNPI